MWQAIGAVATELITAGLSMDQMIKAKQEQKKADLIAAKAFTDANKILDKNVYAAISLPMKQFEIERQNLAAAGAQQVEAGRESQRTAAATAGLTMAQYGNALRNIQSEAEKQYYDLELAKSEEQARRDDIKAQLKLSEAEGAQLASAMYQERAGQAGQQALMGAAGAIGEGLSMVPLFKATKGVRTVSNIEDAYNQALKSGKLSPDLYDASGKPLTAIQAMIKRAGISEDELKKQGLYDEKTGMLLEKKAKDYLASLPTADLQSILRSGFEPFSLQKTRNNLPPYNIPAGVGGYGSEQYILEK